jgi:hypothetical protein
MRWRMRMRLGESHVSGLALGYGPQGIEEENGMGKKLGSWSDAQAEVEQNCKRDATPHLRGYTTIRRSAGFSVCVVLDRVLMGCFLSCHRHRYPMHSLITSDYQYLRASRIQHRLAACYHRSLPANMARNTVPAAKSA